MLLLANCPITRCINTRIWSTKYKVFLKNHKRKQITKKKYIYIICI